MDARRKRVKFRAQYMGSRENDQLFGPFADRYVDEMSETELDTFETLMAQSDVDLFYWVTGQRPVPPEFQTDVLRLIQDFNFNRHKP